MGGSNLDGCFVLMVVEAFWGSIYGRTLYFGIWVGRTEV